MKSTVRTNFEAIIDRINESAQFGINNTKLISAVIPKQAQFDLFLTNLTKTGGTAYSDTINLLNKLSGKDIELFVEGLGKYATIESLQSNFMKELKSSAFSNSLFKTKAGGIGEGELWIAWLVSGARVSGGGESFDITHNEKQQYEVKTYMEGSGATGPFRLGNAGAASRFIWLRRLRHVAEISEEIVKIPSLQTMHPEIYNAAIGMNSRAEKSPANDFSRGEVSKELMASTLNFIDIINGILNTRKTGYDLIEIKSTSPGFPNISLLIEPSSPSDIQAGKFKVIKQINMSDVSGEEALFRMLTKNEYLRGGVSLLISDINTGISEVEAKYNKMTFLVFRKDAMNLASKLVKVTGKTSADIVAQYGSAANSVFSMSGALLRVREAV
jgi:hypothetical protein